MWKCRICSKTFDELPDDAIEIGRGHRGVYRLFKFDGAIHDLRVVAKKPEPPIMVEPEPPVQVEFFQAVIAALAELPEPQPEIIAEPEIESEVEEPMTAMAAAFRRIKS